MNHRELNEIRRRFRPDRTNISRIYGCYVNGAKEIVSYVDSSLGILPQDEAEMYLALMKKALSGTLGKNLIDISFTPKQVMTSEEHRLLQTLRESALEDADARERFYRRVIDSLDLDGGNYLILLACDRYDVPHRGRDGIRDPGASDEVFTYFVCSICPVKSASKELCYNTDSNEFHSVSSGCAVSAPELGFLFPAFDGRTANIYNALMYCRSAAEIHREFIDEVFRVDPPMSSVEQRDAFDGALCTALDTDCRYEVVQSVHDQIRTRIEEHKESRDPENLVLSIDELGGILTNGGVEREKADAFKAECRRQYGDNAELNPANLIEAKKFEVCTPEVKISVSPENSFLIETRNISGHKYLLIPADAGVEINGIAVTLSDGVHV